MFDDKPTASPAGVPQNLPISEPEDLFAKTDSDSISSGLISDGQPSALDVGILRPKEPASLSPSTFSDQVISAPLSPELGSQGALPAAKEPAFSRGILVVIVAIIAVLLIGGAGWWVYRYLNVPQVATPSVDETPINADAQKNEEIIDDTLSDSENSVDGSIQSDGDSLTSNDALVASSTQPVDETILFGEATDTDNDGLDDRREQNLGTNPEKTDTDSDELTDGDEVIIWGTDPLNPDTDGDTFLDGKEVKAGFSPKGSGRLFEVKNASTSTVTSP